jgi:hypothetical protein
MSIFSKLKPQKIVDGIFSGIDKAILSKEEIVDYSVKAASANLEFVKACQTESTPRSITRRIIAIMILGQYFLAFNVGLLGMATEWYEGKEIIVLATEAFATISLAVVIFYFGNHMLSQIIPKFAAKKK